MSFDFKKDILSETENPQDYVKFEGIITDIYNAFPDMEIYNWGYDKDSKKPWMRIKAPIYKDKTLSIKILACIQKEYKHFVYNIQEGGFYVGSSGPIAYYKAVNIFTEEIRNRFLNDVLDQTLVEKVCGGSRYIFIDDSDRPLIDTLKLFRDIMYAENEVKARHIISAWDVEDNLRHI